MTNVSAGNPATSPATSDSHILQALGSKNKNPSQGTLPTEFGSTSSLSSLVPRAGSPDISLLLRGATVKRELRDPRQALVYWNSVSTDECQTLFESRLNSLKDFLNHHEIEIPEIHIAEQINYEPLQQNEFSINPNAFEGFEFSIQEVLGTPPRVSKRIVNYDMRLQAQSHTQTGSDDAENQSMARYVRVSHPEGKAMTKGGIRVFSSEALFSNQALEDGASELAKGMQNKIAVVGLDKSNDNFNFLLAGGKGELSICSKALEHVTPKIFETMGRIAAVLVAMGIHDVPAPDMRSGPGEMDAYRRGLAAAGVQNPDFWITGKGAEGAHPLRPEATGLGVVAVTKQVLEMKSAPFSLQEAKVAVQGVGNVGEHTIHHLLRENASVVAISDVPYALNIEAGLTQKNVADAMQVVRGKLTLEDFNRKHETQATIHDNSQIWDLGANLWIPSAGRDMIKMDHLKKQDSSSPLVIVCGANNALSEETIEALKTLEIDSVDREIYIVPPETANPAGVAGSAFEMKAAIDGVNWDNDAGKARLKTDENALKGLMSTAVETIYGNNISALKNSQGYQQQAKYISADGNELDISKVI